MDDDPLLAVVHAQRQRATASLDKLHAEKARAEALPVLESPGADPDIAERIEVHGVSSALRAEDNEAAARALHIIWRQAAKFMQRVDSYSTDGAGSWNNKLFGCAAVSSSPPKARR